MGGLPLVETRRRNLEQEEVLQILGGVIVSRLNFSHFSTNFKENELLLFIARKFDTPNCFNNLQKFFRNQACDQIKCE